MQKKIIRNTAVILVLCLIMSICITYVSADYKFGNILSTYKMNDEIYVIDETKTNINLIKTDVNGKILDKAVLEHKKNQMYYPFDNLTVDNGMVYFYKLVGDITTNKIISEQVCQYDFQKHKQKIVAELPIYDAYTQNNYGVNVVDNELSYFTIGYDKENFNAQAILHKGNIGGEIKPTAFANYSIDIGFSNLFYSKGEEFVFLTPEGKLKKAQKPQTDNTQATVSNETKTQVTEELNLPVIASQQTKDTIIPPPQINVNELVEYENKELVNNNNVTVTSVDMDKNGNTYFLDSNTGELVKVEYGKFFKSTAANLNDSNIFNNLTESDFKNINLSVNNDFTATITDDNGNTAVAIYENQLKTLYKLDMQTSALFLRGLVLFLALVLIMFAIYMLVNTIYFINKGKFPIVMKLVITCIPIAIISVLTLKFMVTSIFTNEIIDNHYRDIYFIAQQKLSSLSSKLISEIDIKNPYDNVYFYELRQTLNSFENESEIHKSSDEVQKVYNLTFNNIYKLNEGKLYSLYCNQEVINAPIESKYDKLTVNMFYNTANNKIVYRGEYKDKYGEWVVLTIPVLDENENVIAVLETGTLKKSLEYQVYLGQQKINTVNIIIISILVLVLAILIFICLYPLKELKSNVVAITNGDLTARTGVYGNDEISDISRAFNQMSGSVEYHVNELTALNKGYFKFVPSKIFKLLRKDSVIDVKLGDQINSNISILSFNVAEFDKIVGSMTSKDIFKFINDIFSISVPIVTKNEGVVDKFENAGLVAFYTNDGENALNTAISMAEAIKNSSSSLIANNNFTSAISYGQVMLGIVGNEERFAASAVSEHTNLSKFMREIAPKYSAKILITKAVADTIPDFQNKYNYRWIGFINTTANGEMQKLYDVFDGDADVMKKLKANTKELFEKGVAQYCEKKFYDARLTFIEVLKKNRGDYAAKEYLYRCDEYYRSDNKDDIDVFIERY